MSHLPTLPKRPQEQPYEDDEIIMHVFQYLPRGYVRDVCSVVSFGWSEQASSNTLWKFLTEYDLKMKCMCVCVYVVNMLLTPIQWISMKLVKPIGESYTLD
jgi:hypothetical protein